MGHGRGSKGAGSLATTPPDPRPPCRYLQRVQLEARPVCTSPSSRARILMAVFASRRSTAPNTVALKKTRKKHLTSFREQCGSPRRTRARMPAAAHQNAAARFGARNTTPKRSQRLRARLRPSLWPEKTAWYNDIMQTEILSSLARLSDSELVARVKNLAG